MKIRCGQNAKSLKFYYTSFESFRNKSLRIFCSECFFYTAPSVPSVKDGIMLILFDHYVSFLVPIVLLAPKLG